MLTRTNFFVTAVSSDDTETVAAAVELQKPCEMITLRPTNSSSLDNGEGNSTFLPLSFWNSLYWVSLHDTLLQGFKVENLDRMTK